MQLCDVHHLLSQPQPQRLLHQHPNNSEGVDNVVIDDIQRPPIPLTIDISQPSQGMSPKKHHEVERMTQFIANTVQVQPLLRIVDVGAGQGYLTRALHAHFACPTLALDSDQAQTHGSIARGPHVPGITHRTVHISPSTLLSTIDAWIPPSDSPVPVILVALHACGSLTPDLFRALLAAPFISWYPVLVVAVGCCYNLLSPADFPLSSYLRTHPDPLPTPLPASAYQLAAQVPSTWSLDGGTKARLALRKVVWRALLGRLYAPSHSTPMRRLGRLNDSAYASFPHFLAIASARLQVDFLSLPGALDIVNDDDLIARLENLHTMRCRLGPLVESYIILDRVQWLTEELPASKLNNYTVEAINLFDQATGSGRNVALVLSPSAGH